MSKLLYKASVVVLFFASKTMNCWLTAIFLVASSGGVTSLYSAISVGSAGLATMATNLQSLSVVMSNYYLSLNAGHILVKGSLNDLADYVNVTYAAFYKAYAANHSNGYLTDNYAASFNNTIAFSEIMVNLPIEMDFAAVADNLKQAIDSIFQSYSTSLYSMNSYDQTFAQDKCVARNATQMSQIPNSLGKLGPCLQQEVNTAQAITPLAVSTIRVIKGDLIAFNNLLQICQPTSASCVEMVSNCML